MSNDCRDVLKPNAYKNQHLKRQPVKSPPIDLGECAVYETGHTKNFPFLCNGTCVEF